MKNSKKKKLQAAGWHAGTVAQFLDLSPEEAADPSVTVDLLVRALLSLGASRKELGRVIASRAA